MIELKEGDENPSVIAYLGAVKIELYHKYY